MPAEKDYYATLGVPRDAKDEEIKKAFRRLAKDLHPDRGGDAEKFKAVNEAYETLSDGNKRRLYDSGGFQGRGNFNGGGFQNGTNFRMEDFFGTGGMRFGQFGFDQGGQRMNQQFRAPPHVTISISITLGQAYVGGKLTVNYEKNVWCKKCSGAGKIGDDKSGCKECGGYGKKSERASALVEVPPKTMNFTQVTVRGAGNVLKDDQKGDLLVQVTYHPQHEDVTMLHDGTLVKDLHVPWEHSLLGDKYRFTVTSQSSEAIDLVLNPSTPNGGAYRLRGLGMGGGSDLIVKVWHTLPTNIKEEDRKAIARAIKNAKPDTVL